MTGNQSELADYLGIHKATVSRAVRAGRLLAEPDGSFDFEKSAARWHATAGGRADVAARHAAQRGAGIPTGHPSAQNAPAAADSIAARLDMPADDGAGRAGAKAALLHYENQQIKIEMAMRRGLRFLRAAVKRESLGLGSMLRAAVERVIDQTAPRLAAASNELQRRQILDAELKRLRWVIKREMPRALRRMKDEGAE